MKKVLVPLWKSWLLLILIMYLGMLGSCGEEDQALAPYEAGRRMSITVYDTLFTPVISWVGGYVSALGVNKGKVAILDSTLVWLIRTSGDIIRFPVEFGQVPPGAEDVTSNYGGQQIERLSEDNIYTYWVLKSDAWSQISGEVNKPIFVDTLSSSVVSNHNDTLYVNPTKHTQKTDTLDLYITITNFSSFGRLAIISIQPTNTSNNPIVTFTISQTGVTDSLIAALGLGFGGQYNINGRVWEVLSVDTVAGQPVYRTRNVIRSPFVMGQQFPETHVFVNYPLEGLQRNQDYYFWIANKDWDGQSRIRSTLNYAFATFKVK